MKKGLLALLPLFSFFLLTPSCQSSPVTLTFVQHTYLKDSYDENRCSCDDLYQRVAHVELHAEAVGQTSGHTCHGVNLFSEYEGYFIDEYIADDASCRSGHGTHDDGHPHGKSRIESLVYAHYGEKRQSYGVEIEKCVVEVY